MSQQATNGRYESPDKTAKDGPASSLDIYGEAADTADDELLESANLGFGNYDDGLMWQQVESYRHALFGDAAFSRILIGRAIHKTIREMGKERLRNSATSPENESEWIQEKGRQRWDEMDSDQREEAMREHTGIAMDWRPPHWRMMMARHETSRANGARLLDNLFGRKKEISSDEEAERNQSKLRRLGGSR